jgi:dTDP-glucose 4,6-dehydratase
MLSARTGQPMQLHGGGHSERSFIHIHDVVRATLLLAIEAEPGSTWHLSTREAISIRTLVDSICERCGIPFASVVEESGDRLGKDQSYLLDSSAMRERFGWSDQVSLSDGLRDTLAWVDANLDRLKTLPWTYQHKA